MEGFDGDDYIDKMEIYLYHENNNNNDIEVEDDIKMLRSKRISAGMKRKNVGTEIPSKRKRIEGTSDYYK